NRAGLRIDLVDFPGAVLPDPERPLRPREPGIRAAAGRRDRGDHSAGLRIDLLDAILGDLKQIPAVECRAGMRGDVDRPHHLPAFGIERVERVSGSKPDALAVIRDPVYAVEARKRSIFANDLGA